jgi:Spy/CpxP family protein refolding chaperone
MMRAWPIALISLALAFPCSAQESYREFEKGLNLSDAQRAQVDSIKRKYVGEWRALKEESMRKRLELRELNGPDQREKAERAQKELDQLQSARQRLFRQYSGEVSSVFNDEQRDRFKKFRARENRRPMSPPHYRTHER